MAEKNTVFLNMKIRQSEKKIIKRAADLEDRPMSNFVKRAAIQAAQAVIDKEGS